MSRKILGTMAGGAADCSFWLRHLAMQVREGAGVGGHQHHMRHGSEDAHAMGTNGWEVNCQVRLYEEQEGEEMTVARASKLLANRLARSVSQSDRQTALDRAPGHDGSRPAQQAH